MNAVYDFEQAKCSLDLTEGLIQNKEDASDLDRVSGRETGRSRKERGGKKQQNS